MGEAGDKPTRKLFRLLTTIQAVPWPPAPVEGRGNARIFDSADARQARLESSLERLEKRLSQPAKRAPKQKRRKIKHKRRQAKPAQEKLFAKLREKFPSHGEILKKMSPSELCRQLGLDPRNHWSSMKRLRKRLLKK